MSGAVPDLDNTYVHLGTGPEVRLIDVTPDFWSTIDQRTDLHTGRLITTAVVDVDWDVWEMHPAGDEIIIVSEGSVHFRLDDGNAQSGIELSAPQFVSVPAGTWHTADARGGGRLIIITWGEGTEHRPR